MQFLSITTIQTNLHWEDKQANRNMLEEKILSINDKTNIVVLPEMFTTGFSMNPSLLAEKMDGETVAWMRRLANTKSIILVGSLIIEDDQKYYNRLIWMLPNGELGFYDKRHCFSLSGEHEHYTPGTKRLIASVGGWKVNLCICYDLRFPVWTRQVIESDPDQDPAPEFDLLIYLANWPEVRSTAWKTLLLARAIENQCYVVGVNRVGSDIHDIKYSGDSMVIDPLGEIIYHKADDEHIQTIIIDKIKLNTVREKFPFWLDGDHFLITD